MATFDLVGHDWGGMLAWVVGARRPHRVRSLTVVSTPHPRAMRSVLESGDAEQRQRSSYVSLFRQPDKPEQLLLGPDGSGERFRKLFATEGPGTGVDPEVVDEYLAVLSRPGALTAALNWYRAMDMADVANLPRIRVPTLYVWSTGDVALGRAAAEATALEVSGPYSFEVLEGVSHWVPEEASEELNRLLLEHLATA
jgi:pimeloyl-ACP methyl ester carboxylesterase